MNHKRFFNIGLAIVIVVLVLIVTGCGGNMLAPITSYQGRLTNENGIPLNGTVDLTLRLYHTNTGGEPIHTETHTDVVVENGLFDMTVGPSGLGNLTPEDMTRPLWVEIEVDDGTYVETLTPRQRLHGSPYAFTLIPGAVISGTMDTQISGSVLDAVTTIANYYAGDEENPALPSLKVIGESGLEVAGAAGETGYIHSEQAKSHSDLEITSNDEIMFRIDNDGNSTSEFRIYSGNNVLCQINELGNLSCAGTISSAVQADDETRKLYTIKSSEVWFEDFGSGTLRNGEAVINIDPIFASTVVLNENYHVYITPLGDCMGLYVANKTETGFEVHELNGGTSNVGFDYRIVAHQAGYEDVRMERHENLATEGAED